MIGFHNRFSRRLNQTHANVWKVISTFIDEEYHGHQMMVLIRTGVQNKSRPTARQISYQNRVNKLYILYDNKKIDNVELLEGLTRCVANNIRNSKKKRKPNFLYIYIVWLFLNVENFIVYVKIN